MVHLDSFSTRSGNGLVRGLTACHWLFLGRLVERTLRSLVIKQRDSLDEETLHDDARSCSIFGWFSEELSFLLTVGVLHRNFSSFKESGES
jgi:uncharacterized protein (DUF488 family)